LHCGPELGSNDLGESILESLETIVREGEVIRIRANP
jgi:hypothetical protein